MKLGLIGLPQAGKRTLFRLLTGKNGGSNGGKNHDGQGLAKVRDERFDHLVEMYQPRKETPALMEFVLLPDLSQQSESNGQIFRELEEMDVICLLVRTFEEERVFHIEGSVNPERDIRRFNEELQLNDLLFIEKRLERLEKERGKKEDMRKITFERDLMTRMKGHLEDGHFLRTFSFTEEEKKLTASYPLLTRKALLVILNAGEDQFADREWTKKLAERFSQKNLEWFVVSAKIEQELSLLDAAERQIFLDDLKIRQPALDRLTLLCFRTLGLISFFTVGQDEVRAWTIRQGTAAPQAGRVIHSDIERGFIRAEVMKFDDLVGMGSEQKIREVGKLSQKGRDYVVEDGDILNFLFHV
jgi:ribosome-binding ATPase